MLTGCATTPPPGASSWPCRDLEYRGKFAEPGDEGRTRSVRLDARVCRDGRVTLELRGIVGGPILVAASSGQRARLLLVRERLALEGPDVPAFWSWATGVPLATRVLAAGFGGEAPRELEREAARAGLFVEIEGGRGQRGAPRALRARSEEGLRLDLELVDERPVLDEAPWPAIPARFERRSFEESSR